MSDYDPLLASAISILLFSAGCEYNNHSTHGGDKDRRLGSASARFWFASRARLVVSEGERVARAVVSFFPDTSH